MNKLILASACLSLLLGFAHVFGGGPQFHGPALASTLPADQKAVYSILWHFTTAALFINSAALFVASRSARHMNLAWLVALQYLAFGGLFMGYGLARLGSVWILPQWSIFLMISGLAILGLRHSKSQAV